MSNKDSNMMKAHSGVVRNFDQLDLEKYERYLKLIAQLSRLFSDSDKPYIPYRFAERLYLHCYNGESVRDLSRRDNSFDALVVSDKAGVGVKTFVGSDNQYQYKDEKVAEFTKLAKTEHLAQLESEELAYKVASLRNIRVQSDAQEFGIDMDKSIYHCLIRKSGYAFIHEEPYPILDCSNIRPADSSGREITKFPSDTESNVCFLVGNDVYKYSRSKNVLYKRFHENSWFNSEPIEIGIVEDPFVWLDSLSKTDTPVLKALDFASTVLEKPEDKREYMVLPLCGARTALSDNPVVEPKSGINQWNAGGRARAFGEAYISVPKSDLIEKPYFFPISVGNNNKLIGQPFSLELPDGKIVKAKLCQENLKALMSDPNHVLAEWLYAMIDGSLDTAKERFVDSQDPRNRPYKYEDLLKIGKDSVLIIKVEDDYFKLQVLPVGSYRFYKRLEQEGCSLRLDKFLDKVNANSED